MRLKKIVVTNPENKSEYPFVTPLFQNGFELSLAPITILVGENGVGKSTLLESVAEKIGFPLTGGNANNKSAYNDISFVLKYHSKSSHNTIQEEMNYRADNDNVDNTTLAQYINLVWSIKTNKGAFLRSEFFATLINLPRFSDAKAMSHGEGIISVIEGIYDDGVYILDEPEAGLSPIKTIELIVAIENKVEETGAQFIIATHSPVLMLAPDSKLYNISQDEIKEVEAKDTRHFKLTKQILNYPQEFIEKYLKK